jgi:hypothetical protein
MGIYVNLVSDPASCPASHSNQSLELLSPGEICPVMGSELSWVRGQIIGGSRLPLKPKTGHSSRPGIYSVRSVGQDHICPSSPIVEADVILMLHQGRNILNSRPEIVTSVRAEHAIGHVKSDISDVLSMLANNACPSTDPACISLRWNVGMKVGVQLYIVAVMKEACISLGGGDIKIVVFVLVSCLMDVYLCPLIP